MSKENFMQKVYKGKIDTIDIDTVKSIINEIYDSFENRCCSDCKYSQSNDENMNVKCLEHGMTIEGYVNQVMFCAQWELKKDI